MFLLTLSTVPGPFLDGIRPARHALINVVCIATLLKTLTGGGEVSAALIVIVIINTQ